MKSFVTAMSGAFEINSSEIRPETADIKIDQFDGWRLGAAEQRFCVPTFGRVARDTTASSV